jgi:hypothetical protein
VKKIISLFQRNYDGDRLVRDEVVPGAEWVLAGEGVATRKYDGVCTMVRDGKLYKRYEAKAEQIASGKLPPHWEPADAMDANTAKQMGWVPVGDGPEDRWMRDAMAFEAAALGTVPDGTYEFLGPKAQGNVENFDRHVLLRHDFMENVDAPRDYEDLKGFFERHNIEGVVWHHPDGRMVKIKGKDFGLKRRKPLSMPC